MPPYVIKPEYMNGWMRVSMGSDGETLQYGVWLQW